MKKRTNGKMDIEDYFDTRRADPYREGRSMLAPFMLGAVIGGMIGAGIAILYAPAEGSELRRGVSEALDDLAHGAKDFVKSARTSAEKLFSEGLEPDDEEESPLARTRERVDDILEDADRAIAEARRRSKMASQPPAPEEDEREE